MQTKFNVLTTLATVSPYPPIALIKSSLKQPNNYREPHRARHSLAATKYTLSRTYTKSGTKDRPGPRAKIFARTQQIVIAARAYIGTPASRGRRAISINILAARRGVIKKFTRRRGPPTSRSLSPAHELFMKSLRSCN